MKYMSITEAAKLWGLTTRRVRYLCTAGRVPGAVKTNWTWQVPDGADKPTDGRFMKRFIELDLRPGVSDEKKIASLKERYPLEALRMDRAKLDEIIARITSVALSKDDIKILPEDALSILKGRIVERLDLSMHLLIINYMAEVYGFFDDDESWDEERIRSLARGLFRGISRDSEVIEETKRVRFPVRGEEEGDVMTQMRTLLYLLENVWKEYEEVVRASLLYGETIRMNALPSFNNLFSSLVLTGALMKSGLFPALFTPEDAEDEWGCLMQAMKRGNYEALTALVEKAVIRSYETFATP